MLTPNITRKYEAIGRSPASNFLVDVFVSCRIACCCLN
jgi:hypothetical protein